MQGVVYWITGVSGVGKTTIGSTLYYRLKKKKNNVILLDGDMIKDLFSGSDDMYSYNGRKERAFKYSSLCKIISSQGMDVICCTISMFDDVREWNRENIKHYFEIFINTPKEVVYNRDHKNIYKYRNEGQKLSMLGLGAEIEYPKKPDLILESNDIFQVDEAVNKILLLENDIITKYRKFNSNYYWKNYYNELDFLNVETDFAKFVMSFLSEGEEIVDLGCGEGRDSFFFAKNKLLVSAVDFAESAILFAEEKNMHNNIIYMNDDFLESDIIFQKIYSAFYLRFTLHSIDYESERKLMTKIYTSLKANGHIFIEARSNKDSLLLKGKRISENENFLDNHYRRFIDPTELKKELEVIGFEIIYFEENKGFAVSEDENPVTIRCVGRKNGKNV